MTMLQTNFKLTLKLILNGISDSDLQDDKDCLVLESH